MAGPTRNRGLRAEVPAYPAPATDPEFHKTVAALFAGIAPCPFGLGRIQYR